MKSARGQETSYISMIKVRGSGREREEVRGNGGEREGVGRSGREWEGRQTGDTAEAEGST